ncbi:MAG TPA: APC family permease [Mycobacteriales bacterium]|nr:APC family permease [Mycobacteriales bacterium]
MTELARAMPFRSVVSTSTGLAFAAIEYLAVAGLLTVVAGDLAWLAVLASGGLVLLAWAYFSELCGIFPTAAAIRRYMQSSMDDRVALTITFTYMTTIVLVIAADAYIVGSAIADALNEPRWLVTLWIALLLAVATWTNLRGLTVAAAVQDVATTLIVLLSVGIGVLAVTHDPTPAAQALDATRETGIGGFIQAVALGVLLFSAFEWVTTNAEEVTHQHHIPRGMLVSLAILATTCALLAYGMGRLLGDGEISSAFPQLALGRHVGGNAGYWVMFGVTVLTALNTFNGGFITASRFIYATAREGALPRAAAKLNDNFVPWVPVVGLAVASLVVSVVVALTGAWLVLLSVGAALESMIFAVAGYCVWSLRRRQPHVDRPFRMRYAGPLGLFGAVLFGLLALIASVSVDDEVDLRPLLIIAVIAAAAAAYVLAYVPRLRAAAAARESAAPTRRRPVPASVEES